MNLSHPLSGHIGGIYGKTWQTGRIKISIQHSDKLRAQLGGFLIKRSEVTLCAACCLFSCWSERRADPLETTGRHMSIVDEGATLSWSYANEMHHA